MAFEDGTPTMDMRVQPCEPPRRLALSGMVGSDTWRTELLLSDVDGGTQLRFVHHLPTTEGIGEIGPGWKRVDDLLPRPEVVQ